jgi:phosphoribosyl-AMP cyclohydrolase / phosphoribosyl-ATP pyrophosphohydrolase
MLDLEELAFAKGGGYVTVVCQDAETLEVLMVARADRAALEQTLVTGEMHYHSRTRGPWHKGATSGNVQRVVSLAADCDGDAVLARVRPAGPACHTGARSCFGWASAAPSSTIPSPNPDQALALLATTIRERQAALPLPHGTKPSYTQRLLTDRNLRLKKLGEEASELAVACADQDRERAAEEAGDLIYHSLVALAAIGVSVHDVARVLASRAR